MTAVGASQTSIVTCCTVLVHSIIVIPNIAYTVLINIIEYSLFGNIASLTNSKVTTSITSVVTSRTSYSRIVIIVILSACTPIAYQ